MSKSKNTSQDEFLKLSTKLSACKFYDKLSRKVHMSLDMSGNTSGNLMHLPSPNKSKNCSKFKTASKINETNMSLDRENSIEKDNGDDNDKDNGNGVEENNKPVDFKVTNENNTNGPISQVPKTEEIKNKSTHENFVNNALSKNKIRISPTKNVISNQTNSNTKVKNVTGNNYISIDFQNKTTNEVNDHKEINITNINDITNGNNEHISAFSHTNKNKSLDLSRRFINTKNKDKINDLETSLNRTTTCELIMEELEKLQKINEDTQNKETEKVLVEDDTIKITKNTVNNLSIDEIKTNIPITEESYERYASALNSVTESVGSFEKYTESEKVEILLSLISNNNKELRLGAAVGLYALKLKGYNDEKHTSQMQQIIVKAINNYETQDELFLVISIELLGKYQYHLTINSK